MRTLITPINQNQPPATSIYGYFQDGRRFSKMAEDLLYISNILILLAYNSLILYIK